MYVSILNQAIMPIQNQRLLGKQNWESQEPNEGQYG